MSNITLSAAVRSNLLSLQNTASLLDTTQTRLSTGNKVNSALDNPTSYFTASSLNARASDLGNLLDGVSNAVQTIQAANDGITSITKLVESAQSTANQAQQLSETVATAAKVSGSVVLTDASGPTAATLTGSVDARDPAAAATSVGSTDIRDTAIAAVSTGTVVIANNVPATTKGTADLSGSLGSVTTGQGLSITIGGVTKTVTFTTGGGGSGDVDLDPTSDDGAALVAGLNAAFGSTVASLDSTTHALVLTAGNTTDTIAITDTGTAGAKAALGVSDAAATSSVASGLSGALSVQIGSFTGNVTVPGAGSTKAALLGAINTAISGHGTASYDGGGHLVITATQATDSITFGGTSGNLTALGETTTPTAPTHSNSGIAGLNAAGALTVQIGTAAAHTVNLTGVTDQAGLVSAVNTAIGASGTASIDTNGHLKIVAANTTDSITYGGAAANLTTLGVSTTATAPGTGTNTIATGVAAKTLSISVGGTAHAVTLTGVTNQTNLLSAINTALGSAATASIDATTGDVKITANNTIDNVQVSGTAASDLGLATTVTNPGTAAGNTVIAGAATKSLSITIGTTAHTVTLTGATDQASLLTAINTAISGSGTASYGVDGKLNIQGSNTTDSVTVAGTAAADLGLSTTTATANPAGTNPARAAYVAQFNGLLDQIDQLTADAGYNGNNLLGGTTSQLKVLFNETGTSSLTVTGKDTTASGLGLSKLTLGTEFDSNTSITGILAKLKSATDTLRSDASSFGSNLSIVQTRQDFTKALINTLQTGASNLTLADSNEEAANLLALQTRQSLSTKALSLASQSDQNVLRLLQ